MSANRSAYHACSPRFHVPGISSWQAKCIVLVLAQATCFSSESVRAVERPNVLFIAVDDLNHWVGHLGRNPQTLTPHVDRLAGWGVSFAHAFGH